MKAKSDEKWRKMEEGVWLEKETSVGGSKENNLGEKETEIKQQAKHHHKNQTFAPLT